MRLAGYLGKLQSLGELWSQIPRYSWEDGDHRNAIWNGSENLDADGDDEDDDAEGIGTGPIVSLPHFGYEGDPTRQGGGGEHGTKWTGCGQRWARRTTTQWLTSR